MLVTVKSFAKINLGLGIGALRADGFHELRTVYQTIALHDVVRVSIGRGSGVEIRCEDSRVPKDESNTCYRIVERAMVALKARGRVVVEIEKRLPVQGGLGGASGNAVAALLALERALKKGLSGPERLRIAAEVGSDLPLFLIGGTVLGVGRGEEVYPLADLPAISCVVATPEIGVSTPKAFTDWDLLVARGPRGLKPEFLGAVIGTAEAVPSRGRVKGALRGSQKEISGGHDFSHAEDLQQSTPALAVEAAEFRSAWTGEGARPHVSLGDPKLTLDASSDRMDEFGRVLSCVAGQSVPEHKHKIWEGFIRCPCEQRQGPGRDSASRPRPYRDRKRL